MDNPKKVQFLVAHYPMLQGLKLVPIGLLCIYLPIWGKISGGPLSRFLIASMYIGMMVGSIYLIGEWYKRTFGNIRPTLHERLVNVLITVIAGALGGVVFWLDYYALHLSGFLIGLLFAASLAGDYIRALIAIGERNIWFFPVPPVLAIVMALSSLLPLIGVQWWQPLGLRSSWSGVFVMMGLLQIVLGISSHFYLIRSLPRFPEVQNGNTI